MPNLKDVDLEDICMGLVFVILVLEVIAIVGIVIASYNLIF